MKRVVNYCIAQSNRCSKVIIGNLDLQNSNESHPEDYSRHVEKLPWKWKTVRDILSHFGF
jgi:hypothetical protein